MKDLAHESPRTISFTRQVAVIVDVYLLFWAVGHLSLMIFPADSRSVAYPNFYGFLVLPLRGALITGIASLLCFMGWLLMQQRKILVAALIYLLLLLTTMIFAAQTSMPGAEHALKAPVIRVIDMF